MRNYGVIVEAYLKEEDLRGSTKARLKYKALLSPVSIVNNVCLKNI